MSQELNITIQSTDNSLFQAIEHSGACFSPSLGAIYEASIGFADSSSSMMSTGMTTKGSELCAAGTILSGYGA
jgi:hypothetical protein